jgi:hypothetical protein
MSSEIRPLELANAIVDEANLPDRSSYFQLKNFVIGRECTIQSQLWQIVRELEAKKKLFDKWSFK